MKELKKYVNDLVIHPQKSKFAKFKVKEICEWFGYSSSKK